MLHPIAIPILQDNYIWLIRQAHCPEVIAVDPGDAEPLLAYLDNEQLTLSKILITHQHADHIDGLETLTRRFPNVEVLVPAFPFRGERLAGTACQGGEQFTVLDEVQLSVLHVPGHTLNHLAYRFSAPDGPDILCCGDTLFSAGCGRIFEGTPQQMYQSLQLINQLPADTLLCPTHEYTRANLDFARVVEPDNVSVVKQIEMVDALRAQHLPSLPVKLGAERSYNPFLRCDNLGLQQRWQQENGLNLFSFLRNWKNNF